MTSYHSRTGLFPGHRFLEPGAFLLARFIAGRCGLPGHAGLEAETGPLHSAPGQSALLAKRIGEDNRIRTCPLI